MEAPEPGLRAVSLFNIEDLAYFDTWKGKA